MTANSHSESGAVSEALDALAAASGLNCVTHLLTEDAHADHVRLEGLSEDERGALHGVPFVVKANVAVRGAVHDGGSPALRDHRATADAGIVAKLRAAGAIPVALTNMHELAFGITSHNAHYGTVKNPAQPEHMTGGSSGGTAAAVAVGAVPAGVASDTGGSGRLPAAFCGCVGLRPTQGRYPSDGVLTLSHTLDTPTLMARNVATLATFDAVVCDIPPATVEAAATPTLGVILDPFWKGISVEMGQLGQTVLANLVTHGASLREGDAPELEALTEASGFPIALTETKANWERFAADLRGLSLAEFAEEIASPDVRELYRAMAAGEIPPLEAYNEAMEEARPRLRSLFAETIDAMGIDAIVFPTLAKTAPPIGATEEVEINGDVVPFFPAFTRRELAASVAGVPAITVPCGNDAGGLPFGMELVGRAGSDRSLLAIAQFVESAMATPQE